MAHQVTLQEAAGQLPALAANEISSKEIAWLAMAGGAFAWLADEPDLYDDTCGEAICHAAAGTGS